MPKRDHHVCRDPSGSSPPTIGPALNAPIAGILFLGVAVDNRGNFFIADPDNNVVMKVRPDGILSVVAGNGILGFSGDGGAAVNASLVIRCTGLGAVDPPMTAGAAAPESPASRAVNAVSVTIGGKPATVTFAGLVPGSAGLYQIRTTRRMD